MAQQSNPGINFWKQTYFLVPGISIAVLALIHYLNTFFELHLHEFGIYPRKGEGLIGIITSPLLHGDWDHLQNNSISLFALGAGLLFFYPRKAWPVIIMAWVFSGVGVWLWGRESYHIGASGLIYGLAAFIFISGLLRAHPNLLALSMLVVFLYGSMVWGLVPSDPQISYEAHLSGAIIGALLAVYFRNSPPRGFPRHFSYQDIDDDLSEQIERFGPDYWRQDTDDQNSQLRVHYHYKEKEQQDE